jgi:hypothetical protein
MITASCTGLCGVASILLGLINTVFVPVLFAIAFVVFIYGIAKTYVFSHGEPEEVAQGHKLLLWGLIGFAVMVSVWGIVNVVTNTFGLNTIGSPATPTFTPSSSGASGQTQMNWYN